MTNVVHGVATMNTVSPVTKSSSRRPSYLEPSILWPGDHVSGENNENRLLDYSDIGEHQQMIGETVFEFLMTHAPNDSDAPLGGIFTQAEDITAAWRQGDEDAPHLISIICDLLGFVSVSLVHELENIFLTKNLEWREMLRNQLIAEGDVETIRRLTLEDIDIGKCSDERTEMLSVYHWHALQEMFYHSRVMEISGAKPRRGLQVSQRNSVMCLWLMTEANNEFQARKRRYAAWYALPITEKTVKLRQVLHLVMTRLPAEVKHFHHDRVEPSNAMRRKAAMSGPGVRANFAEWTSLVDCLKGELSKWEYQVQVMTGLRAGGFEDGDMAINPAFTGFPSDRDYLIHVGRGPVPGVLDRDAYPEEMLRISEKCTRHASSQTARGHPGLRYQRPTLIADIADKKTQARHEKVLAEVDKLQVKMGSAQCEIWRAKKDQLLLK